ncbi:MAG: hypothetical protein OXE52_06660 [Chloroflexi bacterium]|nr:hypothetical protein [Chloroflexota bacterium]
MTSTQEELIRYRIERRMAGRRDILLHVLVYVLVLAGLFVNLPWWDASARLFFAAFWAIPLLLQLLRYYYQNGPGVKNRVLEIERGLELLTALDEEEEALVEERIAKRITARRLLVAHLLTLALTLPLLWLEAQSRGLGYFDQLNLTRISAIWGAVGILHLLRFYIVHGKTAAGRALKIERELERQWHLSLARRRQRRYSLEALDENDDFAPDGELMPLRAARITAEGELVDDVWDEEALTAPRYSR